MDSIFMKRTFLDFKRSFGVVLCLTFLCFLTAFSSNVGAQGDREFGRRVARVVQSVPNVLANQSSRSLNEAAVPFPSGGGLSSEVVVGSRSIYRVGVQNISWRSHEGRNYRAIVYHPTTPPVAGSKFGVVIYSHGLGASPEEFGYLGRAWASRGVVTLTLHHPETDESVWRGKARPMAALKEAYRKYWPSRDRAKAIRAAIDYIYDSHYSPGPLGSDVDLGRIAVAGNDLGALGALLVAGQLPPDNGPSLRDDRVAAVLALSPPVFCEERQGARVYSGISAPLMVVTGTKDDGIVGSTKAYQRRLPYDSVRKSDRYLVVLNGGDHRVYGRRVIGSDTSYHETIAAATADYLSAYLLSDYDVLMALRQYGSATSLGNASVERALTPFSFGDIETVGMAPRR